MEYGDPRYDEDEAFEFLRKLMPQGFAGSDVMAELAPEGWERSGLVRAYHPGVEQAHAEAVAMHENLERLRGLGRKRRGKPAEEEDVPLKQPPTLEEFRSEYKETPVRPEEECRDIVGCVLWEVFSDNHSVIADDGREVDLGSFRGASSTLDAFDRDEAADSGSGDWMDVWDRGDHMRFYCGLAFISGRTDYGPVYEMVFRRLRSLDADWIYRFPRIGVVRFEKPEELATQLKQSIHTGMQTSLWLLGVRFSRLGLREGGELSRAGGEVLQAVVVGEGEQSVQPAIFCPVISSSQSKCLSLWKTFTRWTVAVA